MPKSVKIGKKIVNKPATKPTKQKKLSKAGEWLEVHPNGLGGTYDMRAVMR